MPIHITGAYQDEQTGPRGPTHLWEQVPGVPKRLVLTNGDHNTPEHRVPGPEVWADRKAWIDHFMGVKASSRFGTVAQDKTSVTTLLETHRTRPASSCPTAASTSHDVPARDSRRGPNYYLRAGRRLSTTAQPGATEAPSDSYVSAIRRQAWSYQAGPELRPAVHDGRRTRRAALPHRADDARTPRSSGRSPRRCSSRRRARRHRAVRAADRRGARRQPHLPPARHAEGQPQGHRRDQERLPERALYRPWRPHTNPQLDHARAR